MFLVISRWTLCRSHINSSSKQVMTQKSVKNQLINIFVSYDIKVTNQIDMFIITKVIIFKTSLKWCCLWIHDWQMFSNKCLLESRDNILCILRPSASHSISRNPHQSIRPPPMIDPFNESLQTLPIMHFVSPHDPHDRLIFCQDWHSR